MPQLTGVARLRLSPGEVERLLRDERERRRKLRITQVREKAKTFAKSKLEAVKKEKVRQLEILAEQIEEEWEVERQNRIEQLEQEYADSLKCIGEAHTQADEVDLGLERKAMAMQENQRRAEERYASAIAKLKEDRLLQTAEDAKVTQARELAVAKEKIRAREIASLPPPIKPDLNKLLHKAKAAYAQMTDADTYTYPYQIPSYECLVERNDESVNDGIVGAEQERAKEKKYQLQTQSSASERLEKARVRGAHALKRERMRQSYDHMMTELDLLEKADRKHRQQNLEHIPQSLFLPAHVVMERETDRQTQMERRVEDVFADEYDQFDLRDCAPALNSDLTPSVTETTGLSSSEIEPKPPITRVRDGDLNRERTPLKNVTNTALTSDNTDTDGDSEKKRKKVLKKILRKIDHQKEQWENEGKEDDLDTSTHRVPEDTHHTLPPASPKPRELSTPPAPTAPPVPSTPPVPTASQLPTTPLVHHSPMRHQLQNAHLMGGQEPHTVSTPSTPQEMEQFPDDDTSNAADINESPHFAGGTEVRPHSDVTHLDTTNRLPGESTWEWYLRQKAKLGESIRRKISQMTSTAPSNISSTQTRSNRGFSLDSPHLLLDQTESNTDISGGAPKTGFTLHKDTLESSLETSPESLQLQLDRFRNNERFASEDVVRVPHPPGYMSVTERSVLARGGIPERTYNLATHNNIIPEAHSNTVADVPALTTQVSDASELVHQISRVSDISTHKDAVPDDLTYGGIAPLALPRSDHRGPVVGSPTSGLPHNFQGTSRGRLDNSVSPKRQARQDSNVPGFVSVSERERLMRAPLVDSVSSEIPELRNAEKLRDDLAEHSRTLQRLQEMMSSTRDEHFIQPTASSQMQSFDQSQSKISVHPQPSYMPVVERESLLMDLPQSSTQSSRLGSQKPTWGDVLSSQRISTERHNDSVPYTSEGGVSSSLSSNLSSTYSLLPTGPRTQPPSSTLTSQYIPSAATSVVNTLARPSVSPLVELSGRSSAPSQVEPSGRSALNSQPDPIGWSVVHQQMLARQQEFNRRQEELRKQLAEIQEQKRKLLAPSRLENLDAAQDGLGRILGDAVGELDGDYFTPNRSTRPPVTFQPGLVDLDLHELSIIQEVDTPTHLNTHEESSLMQSLANLSNPRGSVSRSIAELDSVTPSMITSERSGVREKTTTEPTNTNQNAQVDVEEDILSTQMPQVRGVQTGTPTHDLLSTQATAPPPDQERLKVLNQLLAQLEERRVQRQSFLDKERLTTLLDENEDRAARNADRSIPVLDLYSSDSAGDILISAPLSSNESRESTPSGDTLTKNIHQSNQEWIQRPKPVPLSQQFSSSDSTSAHSSDKLRQLYADIANAGTESNSIVGSSPRLYNLEELLQGVSSVSDTSSEGRDVERVSKTPTSRTSSDGASEDVPHDVKDDKVSGIQAGDSIKSCITEGAGRIDSGNGGGDGAVGTNFSSGDREHSRATEELNVDSREHSRGDREVSVGSREHRTAAMSREADKVNKEVSGSDGSLSQESDTSSVSKERSELTQTADNNTAISIIQSEESLVTMKTLQHSTNSSIASLDSPMKSLHLNLQQTIDEGSVNYNSTPVKRNPDSQLPSKQEELGVLDEPEITFASTVGDRSIALDSEMTVGDVAGGLPEQSEFSARPSQLPEPSRLSSQVEWVSEDSARELPAVRQKTVDVDIVARRRQQRESAERTQRLYNQLAEVKQKKLFKEREQRRADVQVRRKEYSSQLQNRTKK